MTPSDKSDAKLALIVLLVAFFIGVWVGRASAYTINDCVEQFGSKPKSIRAMWGNIHGYSGCGICGETWDYTKEHLIEYDNKNGGAFPICEKCFRNASLDQIDHAIDLLVSDWKCQDSLSISKIKMDFDNEAKLMKIQVRKERQETSK